MQIKITKSGRQFGYIIWNQKNNSEMQKLLNNSNSVDVVFNGIAIGNKEVDWKYYRISIGYKFTRGISEEMNYYNLICKNGRLEVTINE